jgi:hypothetical protein
MGERVVNVGGALLLAESVTYTDPDGQVVTAYILKVGSHEGALLASQSFTRPADTTAYASGDLVANSTVAGSVVPLALSVARTAGGTGSIRRARLRKTGTSITSAAFRLHLYSASPVPSNGDNGAWLTTQAAAYMGAIDVTLDKAFTDGAFGAGTPNAGAEINFDLASGQTIYGLIEARGAYTPVSGETFTVDLEVWQD